MCDDVREHFFARHPGELGIGERELELLGKCPRIQHPGIFDVPTIRGSNGFVQCLERRCFRGVRGGVPVTFPFQVGGKDAVHHVDVIEDANGRMPFGMMRLFVDRS